MADTCLKHILAGERTSGGALPYHTETERRQRCHVDLFDSGVKVARQKNLIVGSVRWVLLAAA
jgi:hypothetical protein